MYLSIPAHHSTFGELNFDTSRQIQVPIYGDQCVFALPFILRANSEWKNKIIVDRISGTVNGHDGVLARISQDHARLIVNEQPWSISIECVCAATDLQKSEIARGGSIPKLTLNLTLGLIEQSRDQVTFNQANYSTPLFHTSTVVDTIEVPRDMWIAALERCQFAHFFLIESKLQNVESHDLVQIAKKAHKYLLDGGSSSWQACIAEIRKGLEKLKNTYELEKGKFSQNPFAKTLTRLDRVELQFWSLYHYTHLSHHEDDIYTLQEAQMALAGFLNFVSIFSKQLKP